MALCAAWALPVRLCLPVFPSLNLCMICAAYNYAFVVVVVSLLLSCTFLEKHVTLLLSVHVHVRLLHHWASRHAPAPTVTFTPSGQL